MKNGIQTRVFRSHCRTFLESSALEKVKLSACLVFVFFATVVLFSFCRKRSFFVFATIVCFNRFFALGCCLFLHENVICSIGFLSPVPDLHCATQSVIKFSTMKMQQWEWFVRCPTTLRTWVLLHLPPR